MLVGPRAGPAVTMKATTGFTASLFAFDLVWLETVVTGGQGRDSTQTNWAIGGAHTCQSWFRMYGHFLFLLFSDTRGVYLGIFPEKVATKDKTRHCVRSCLARRGGGEDIKSSASPLETEPGPAKTPSFAAPGCYRA